MAVQRVIIYGTASCGFCVHARNLLDKKGVEYKDIRLEGQLAKRQEMEQRSGATSVPQIWIGDKHIGGCMELCALESSQELDGLLAIENQN